MTTEFTPASAREHIAFFLRSYPHLKGASHVVFEGGRTVYFNNMTDDDAIHIANEFLNIEIEACKGAPKQ